MRYLLGQNKKPGGQNAKRLKAFVLLMRYSGLRISDAIQLNEEKIQGNRIFLYTQKTSVHVYVPMPPIFFEAASPSREIPIWLLLLEQEGQVAKPLRQFTAESEDPVCEGRNPAWSCSPLP